MIRSRLRAALLVVLIVALTACAPAEQEQSGAPELAGPGLDGAHIDLADYRGSVVIVAAWASWCTVCRSEFPVFERAQQDLGGDGLELIGLNLRDRPEAAVAALQQTGLDLPSIVDSDGTLSVHWGVRGLPTTFLVDRDGEVVDVFHGQVTQEWIENVVAPVVQT